MSLAKIIKNWVDAHKAISIPLADKESEILVWERQNKMVYYQPKFHIRNFCEAELVDSIEVSKY